MNVGERIRELRIKKGLTQQELAKKAGCSQSALSKIESEGRSPRFEIAISIAGILGVSAEYLRKGDNLDT